ncbi:MAG TPA: hypothetical protein VK897_23920 [Anaerolineales bacterium]|nr:hypothetical protein [Anaerolineales bacterium]
MKSRFLFPLLILLAGALILAACGGQPASAHGYGTEEFLAELREKGVEAEKGDSVEQGFFSVIGTFVNFNGESVQVFEYDSAETMESDAVLVDAEGSSIGTSMVSWVATPHFYKKGRILVLYVGDNAEALETLESVLGPQFAGR